MNDLGLVDIFRERNPEAARFSWRKFGDTKRARLDFHLVSAELIPFVQKSDILPGICSDHSIAELEIDFSKFSRGKGFFKFNNSLTKDPKYVEQILDTITTVAKQYSEDIYRQDYFELASPEQLQETVFNINPQLFLETLLFEIRGKTIEYCATKQKLKKAALNLALHRLESAEIASDLDPGSDVLMEQLNVARCLVEKFEQVEAEGAMIRARANWQLHGEKPSKYFCNLEKYNALQKYIPELKVKDEKGTENVVTDQKTIDKEIKSFYSKLYKNQDDDLKINTIDKFLGSEIAATCPKISEKEALKMEGLVTLNEATSYIKNAELKPPLGPVALLEVFTNFFGEILKYLS